MRLKTCSLSGLGLVMLASMAGFIFVGCRKQTSSEATPTNKATASIAAAPTEVNLALMAKVFTPGGGGGGNNAGNGGNGGNGSGCGGGGGGGGGGTGFGGSGGSGADGCSWIWQF